MSCIRSKDGKNLLAQQRAELRHWQTCDNNWPDDNLMLNQITYSLLLKWGFLTHYFEIRA